MIKEPLLDDVPKRMPSKKNKNVIVERRLKLVPPPIKEKEKYGKIWRVFRDGIFSSRS